MLCEAEVNKSCNLCRKFGTVSIFTILDEGLQFIYNNYSGAQRNNGIRWKVMQNYVLENYCIAMLGMQNEGCWKYLDVQSIIERIGLLRAF